MDKLYDARNVELWALTDEEKIENKEINNKDLQIALSNLPNCFEEVCNNIKECVNKKIDGERELTGYYTKKYYEAGFSDAVKLIWNEAMRKHRCRFYWRINKHSGRINVSHRQWRLITEYEHYATFMWLVNQLRKAGKSNDEILNQIVKDSKELGHYYDLENSTRGKDFELTGSRCVCGLYDLANTFKILACSNEEAGGFWLGGGNYNNNGNDNPLANLNHNTNVDNDNNNSVGLLVL